MRSRHRKKMKFCGNNWRRGQCKCDMVADIFTRWERVFLVCRKVTGPDIRDPKNRLDPEARVCRQ